MNLRMIRYLCDGKLGFVHSNSKIDSFPIPRSHPELGF